MKIAHIPPANHSMLSRYATGTYHMCLASWYTHDDYSAFYRGKAGEEGWTVILDNGMYELSKPVDNVAFRLIAEDIRPSILILPDVKDDSIQTLDKINSSVYQLKSPDWKLMGVAQGRDYIDIETCVRELDAMPFIDVIGLPVRMPINRLGFLNRLNMKPPSKPVHLLGCNFPLVEEIRIASMYEWVQGMDTAKGIRYGLEGIAFHPLHGAPVSLKRSASYHLTEDVPFEGIVEWNQFCMQMWSLGYTEFSWRDYWSQAERMKK